MPKNHIFFSSLRMKACWQIAALMCGLACGAAQAQMAQDTEADTVTKNVRDLFYQSYQPRSLRSDADAAALQNFNGTAGLSRGSARKADDDAIRSNVMKLFSQGERKTVNPAPLMPARAVVAAPSGGAVALAGSVSPPPVINVAPVDQLAPTALVEQAAPPVVADKAEAVAAAVPAPVQQPAVPALAPTPAREDAAAVAPPVPVQATPIQTATTQTAATGSESVPSKSRENSRPAPQPATALAVPPAAPFSATSSAVTQTETRQPEPSVRFMADDEQASGFLQGLAGTEAVALNVTDSDVRATLPGPVHLDEAVAFALKNNFEALASHAKLDSAYWDKMGGYAEYFPSMQLADASGPERSNPASVNDANGNRVLDNTHHRRDLTISVRQPLIDLGILADIQSLSNKQDIADIEGRDAREGIAYDTIAAYLDLIQARLSVQLADQYKAYLDRLAVRMKSRVEGGGGTSADLERIYGRAANADAARVQAMGDYEATVAELRRLTKIVPTQIVIPKIVAPPVPEDMQAAKEAALKYNPSYLGSQKKADLASADRNKSFSGLLPKILLEYTKSHSFNAGGAAEGNPVDGVYPYQDTQSVMLVAEWGFGATSVTSGISGMAKTREMNLRSLDVRQRLEQGIESGYAAVNAARQREAALRKMVEANGKVVKGFDLQYDAGGRSLFDLLDANEQLYNAKLNLMRVTIAGAKAAYQIRRQMGQLVPSLIGSERG